MSTNVSEYVVKVEPSNDPNRGQYFWTLSERTDDRIVRHIAAGTNDSKTTCFEQAEEAIQRDRLGVEERTYAK